MLDIDQLKSGSLIRNRYVLMTGQGYSLSPSIALIAAIGADPTAPHGHYSGRCRCFDVIIPSGSSLQLYEKFPIYEANWELLSDA